jgi:hypothetical protein
MAICQTCGRSMPSALSCTKATITYSDGVTLDRLAFMGDDKDERCPECGVDVGGFHHVDLNGHCCEQEICPRCGKQLLICWLMKTCEHTGPIPPPRDK